jgi:NAD(P)-dependent dehydrogenase (short-subunit alcohol dehydrogenase family)
MPARREGGGVVEGFSLAGKSAVVIGASNPLGRAAAVALAEAGANVGVATTTRAKKEEVIANSCANEIWALDRKGFALSIDASLESDIDALAERAASEFGPIDILVNAHDLPYAKPIGDISFHDWRRTMDVNLGGVFLATKLIGGAMVKQGKGRIINVSTVMGERGMTNGTAYCAAQAGVLNMTRALALEWARTGVTVNAIGAGWTEGMGIIGGDENRQQLERYLPYKRLAKPDEIAGIAVYLASDAAEYMTGQVIWIEGGALSHV